MDKKIKKKLFWIILFVFLLNAGFACLPSGRALALETHYPTIAGQSLNETSTFAEYICYIVSLGTTLAISLSAIVIAFGGIYYLISYGQNKFTSEGKEWVKAGILGLFVILASYSIIYTINPNLTDCKFGFVLPWSNLSSLNNNSSNNKTGANTVTFKEIPMGVLTENLLARTTDCYGFDQDGNPIDGDKLPTGEVEPTYMNHDRADCLTQLIDGAQKKAQVIANLSTSITNLMNECSCAGKCDDTCNGQTGCNPPPAGTPCPVPAGTDTSNICTGACKKAACKQQPNGPKDCCPTDSGVKDANGKELSVKEQIEHGPIIISDSCPNITDDGCGNSCAPGYTCEAGECVPGGAGAFNYNNLPKNTAYDSPAINIDTYLLASFSGFNLFPSANAQQMDMAAAFAANASSMNSAFSANINLMNSRLSASWLNETNLNTIVQTVQSDFSAATNGVQSNFRAASSGIQSNFSAASSSFQNQARDAISKFQDQAKDAISKFQSQAGSNPDVDRVSAALKAQLDGINAKLDAKMNEINAKLNADIAKFNARFNSEVAKGNAAIAKAGTDARAKINADTASANAKICLDVATANAKIKSDIAKAKADLKSAITTAGLNYNTSLASAKGSIKKFIKQMGDDAVSNAVVNALAKTNPDVGKIVADTYDKFYASRNSTSTTIDTITNNNVSAVSSANSGASSAVSAATDQITSTLDVIAGSCGGKSREYKGLDEFRSKYNNDYKSIKAAVEKTISAEGRKVTIIDTGSCGVCNNNSPDDCQQKVDKCIKDKQPKSPWYKLPLIDQLTYFNGKIDEIKNTIKDDEDELDKARSELSKCYLSTTSVDLLKTYKETNQTQTVILTEKTFSDPQTGDKINASKYCQGFNYDNSSCLKKCNDICPDTSPQVIQAYARCGTCPTNDKTCLSKQETCIKKAYDSRPCIYGTNTSQTFNGKDDENSCIASCQDDCQSNCEQRYLPCSGEFDFCVSQCYDNSQCVLDNADTCLFNAGNFVNCATQNTDPENTNYCINNAYTCKNGSNEYAGYPDCVGTSSKASGCSTDQYSASFFYDNPKCQKCPDPYSTKNGPSGKGGSCQEQNPKTVKCPTSSNCPSCKCSEIDQTISFSVPNKSVSDKKQGTVNAGSEGYSASEKTISAHQIVGPQCNSYSYNDDPLTFYCLDQWWEDPLGKEEGTSSTPIGSERVCSDAGEVPVGQTVDNARSWADNLASAADKANKNIKSMIDQMIKIGKAKDTSPVKDYCGCTAKFENNKPVCTTDCQYGQALDTSGVWEYNQTLGWQGQEGGKWICGCTFVPCDGSPCQQITDYLSQLWNNYRQLKLDFIDFYTNMVTEPRSDIMKELTYSRQKTDECSLTSNNYGTQTRLLDCTRVQEEIIPPTNTGQTTFNDQKLKGYCYGTDLGNLFDKSLTDNWFCCQEYAKDTNTKNNPLLNK